MALDFFYTHSILQEKIHIFACIRWNERSVYCILDVRKVLERSGNSKASSFDIIVNKISMVAVRKIVLSILPFTMDLTSIFFMSSGYSWWKWESNFVLVKTNLQCARYVTAHINVFGANELNLSYLEWYFLLYFTFTK